MAKVIELESGVDPVEEVPNPKQDPVNETEAIIQRLMQKAYMVGIGTGMKTMCGAVLSKLEKNKNLNPQKQLMILRQWCQQNMDNNKKVNDEKNDSDTKKEESENA